MDLDSALTEMIENVIPDMEARKERYLIDTSEVDQELLLIFLEQMDLNISAMKAARQIEDLVAVANEAHSIKGMGGTAGMPELSVLAEELEKVAKQGDVVRCDALFGTLGEYFAKVKVVVEGLEAV